MKIYDTYNKVINLIIALTIISIITIAINKYFAPFFIVIIMFIIVQPIYKFLLKSNINKGICAIISILLANISFFVVIYYFGNSLLQFIYRFYVDNILEVNSLINTIKNYFNLDINKTMQGLSRVLNSNIIMQGAIITGDSIISYLLANIISYFMLVDKEKIYDLFNHLFPVNFMRSFWQNFRNLKEVLKVEFKLILLSALIITVGLRVLGINNFLLLGAICSILDVLPFVGTAIVFIPIIIYNIIIKRYILVIGLISLYILERFIREILEAKFLSSKLEIHPLIIILSIYIGVNMFGFIGILAGPIYSIIAKDVIYNE